MAVSSMIPSLHRKCIGLMAVTGFALALLLRSRASIKRMKRQRQLWAAIAKRRRERDEGIEIVRKQMLATDVSSTKHMLRGCSLTVHCPNQHHYGKRCRTQLRQHHQLLIQKIQTMLIRCISASRHGCLALAAVVCHAAGINALSRPRSVVRRTAQCHSRAHTHLRASAACLSGAGDRGMYVHRL